jgi:drug/metabolite transporter (DMT)-like permease
VGEALAALALTLFSCNIILTKVASGRIAIGQGFLVSVAVNVAFGLLLFGGQVAVWGWPRWNWEGFALFLVSGLFSVSLGRFFFFDAVVRFGPTRASLFQVVIPLFTVLLAAVGLGERLSGADLAGIALSVAGLFLVVYTPGAAAPPAEQGGAPQSWRERLRPWASSMVAVGCAASLAYAIGNVLRGAAMARWSEPLLGGIVAAAGALVVHLALSREGRRHLLNLGQADRKGVALFMAAGAITICAQSLMIASLRYTAVSIATLIASCVPVLVMPLSWLLLRHQERIGPRTVAGTALTIAGLAIVLLL